MHFFRLVGGAFSRLVGGASFDLWAELLQTRGQISILLKSLFFPSSLLLPLLLPLSSSSPSPTIPPPLSSYSSSSSSSVFLLFCLDLRSSGSVCHPGSVVIGGRSI